MSRDDAFDNALEDASGARPAPPSGAPADASLRFLAAAFAAWCDQKSRLSAARASGLIDDAVHDVLMEDYTRTRDRIGALLARAETLRAARRPACAPSPDGPAGLTPGRRCPAC